MSYVVPRDKPQGCRKCPYIDQYNDCRLIWGSERIRTVEEQYQHCPLIEVPTPHGRLIDGDELVRIWKGAKIYGNIEPIVNARPTVIEAED